MVAVYFTTIPCEPSTVNRPPKADFFAKFVAVRTTLCMIGLKFLELSLNFYKHFKRFRTLGIMGKCTSWHLFRHGGFWNRSAPKWNPRTPVIIND